MPGLPGEGMEGYLGIRGDQVGTLAGKSAKEEECDPEEALT